MGGAGLCPAHFLENKTAPTMLRCRLLGELLQRGGLLPWKLRPLVRYVSGGAEVPLTAEHYGVTRGSYEKVCHFPTKDIVHLLLVDA